MGGLTMLPKGFVSDEFNHDMSKIELRFMRNSIIAMPRQLVGPGRRGKSGIKHATRSEVLLIGSKEEPGVFSLGYLQLARAVPLPQIRIDIGTGLVNWSVDAGQPQPDQFFLNRLSNISQTNIRYISTRDLPQQEILIGFDEHLYIARPKGSTFTISPELIRGLMESIQTHSSPANAQHQQININQIAYIDDDFYRVCAKTALNTLALLKGKAYALQPMFDPVRGFITNGGPNHFATYVKASSEIQEVPLYAHRVIVGASAGMLVALVCFYNQFAVSVILSPDFRMPFAADGLMCDWKNKKEYRLGGVI
jgi:hypothetical protein